MNSITKYTQFSTDEIQFHTQRNYITILNRKSEKIIIQTPKLLVPYDIYTFQSGAIKKQYS